MPQAAFADASVLRDDLVERARAMFESIRGRAVAAERARRIPAETAREYAAAGLVRTLQPKAFGGHELDFTAAFDVSIEIGRACGSSGWVLSYYTDHAYLVALFPEAAQRDVWRDDPDARIATSFVPAGTVGVVEGGYRLSGDYAWASGIDHSSWIIAGALVPGSDHPEYRLFLVPRSDFEVRDTWHSAGLTASGSNNVEFKDVFVPEHRTVTMEALREGRAPGALVHAHPMYRVPLIGIASQAILGPAIGIARGAVEAWTGFAKAKVHSYTREQVAAGAPIQIRLAEVVAEIDAAELLVRRAIATVERWEPLTLEERVRNRRDFTFAMRALVRAMDALLQIGGASALFESNPLQRAWRDVHAIATHTTMNFEAAGENFGRTALGLSLNPRDPFF